MGRLFVACDLPNTERKRLAALVRPLAGARWVRTEQLHLTLRFIGEADEAQARAIDLALREIRQPAFSISLAGLGCFPGLARPRVLWAGIEAEEGLARLQARIETVVRGVGFAPETKAFRPHVTLARFRIPDERATRSFLAKWEGFGGEPFRVDSFRLYASVLTGQGAEHTVRADYPLG